MITITVTREQGRVCGVEIKGHSGYAKCGKDIVCAAVSATAQTALMGLIKYSPHEVDYTVGENGYMRFAVPQCEDETDRLKLDTIVETMLLGLGDIESGYKAFVKLEEK